MSNDIHFIGFNKYTRQPIKENTYKNWVMNGKNNENYQYIIDRYNGSTTNKAVNNAYMKLCYGRGLSIHEQEDATSEDLKRFNEIMSIRDVRSVVTDFQILNEFSVQIHRQKGAKNKLAKIEHISKSNVIPSVADEDGIIKSYWYSADWTKQYQTKYKPKEYPALGFAEDFDFELPEIYVAKPYCIGQEYFPLPDYDSALQYAEIEEEISNYIITHIKNGLSFGTIINVPNSNHWTDEQKRDYINNVKGNYSGSTGAGKMAFNFKSPEGEDTTISNVENNTAHKQWDFLSQEAREKILTGHECTSSSLVGINTSTGFSSNAQEMEEMRDQLLKYVIAPKQDFILDGIFEVLDYFGLKFDLYFRPLTEIEGEVEETEKVNDDALELSKKKSEFDFLEDYAENEPIDFELHRVDYDITEPINLSAIANSEQDTELWKIRYAYNVGTSKTPKGKSRGFCNKMISLSQQGKVFRKEDIEKMKTDGVNSEFGHEKKPYDIFLYAGGVNCYHRWERRIYKKKRDENGKPLGGNAMQNTFPVSVSEARRQGAKIPKNEKDVAIAEIDKPNRGAYPG